MTCKLIASDQKYYPHFDSPISLDEANSLVADPVRVAHHKFYPFIQYNDEWKPFRPKDSKEEIPKKSRPIRYAARRDAYIFTYYRRILSKLYENKLTELKIGQCPIAYRKIVNESNRGKCNIDFAKDAFDEICRLGDCVAIALDIRGFFENLDHARIKHAWCYLLGVNRLPEDHYRVFKNLTKYHYVEKEGLYHRLGYLEKSKGSEHARVTYTTSYKNMPKQLCSPQEFREKVCGGDPDLPSIIKSNADEDGNLLDRGIPQGAPISDLIANFYMLDFDKEMNSYATEKKGRYMRYSDDILLILPGDRAVAKDADNFAKKSIRQYGEKLEIKTEKTCIGHFKKTSSAMNYQHLEGPHGKNGFEYLGFRFDGKYVYLRDSTLSRLFSKATKTAHGITCSLVKDNPGKNPDEICQIFDYSLFFQKYSKVCSKILSQSDYRTWTFHSYVKRAAFTFSERGSRIPRQARNFKRIMRSRICKGIEKAVERRDKSIS
ncbi:MAG: reverse transcriptase/maturase family protein [Gammaproteobacteria bacterium]|nr:reverse transcriptase/maturase family protein [Gammaproteobacteria bacterium]